MVSRWRTADGTCLRLLYAYADHWADFVIDERGRSVRAARSENVRLDDLAELLTSQVFSLLLAQRGLTCLHAAVVQIDGRVLALVGATGAGKSTTALALLHRGAKLLSDDVAVLREAAGAFSVSLGVPRLRLRPDTAESLVGSLTALEPIWAHQLDIPEKRYLQMSPRNGAGADRPLDAVCLLGGTAALDQGPRLQPLTAAEALPRLMANRHMVGHLDRDAHARDFERLARLAVTVPTAELVRPHGLATIERTAAVIEAGVEKGG